MYNKRLIVALLIITLLLIFGYLQIKKYDFLNKSEEYNPQINPADFTSNITNKYFTIMPGKKWFMNQKPKMEKSI
ncbi:MAG TPA: hypothetical protein VJH65_03105 [Candidatus Nanoarchaeia archaeon]|nr:hypothetical protein [Candidatus Nanoarchaeia archaeon]